MNLTATLQSSIPSFLRRPLFNYEPRGFGIGERVALYLLAGAFIGFNIIEPALPGMTYEGMLKFQFIAAQLLDLLSNNSIWRLFVEGRLPAGIEVYHGVLPAYLFTPFLAIFGRHWLLIKFWPLLFDGFAVVFTYLFLKNLFGRRTALVCLVMLFLNATYVAGVRIDGYSVSHMHFYSMGALYFLSQWWISRNHRWMFLSMSLLGWGMSTHVWFAWFILAGAICALFFRRRLSDRIRVFSRKETVQLLLAAAGGLLTGSLLLVYREIHSPVRAALLEVVLAPGISHDLTGRVIQIGTNLAFFHYFLAGGHFFERLFAGTPGFVTDPGTNYFFSWSVYLSAVLLLLPMARKRWGTRVRLLPALFLFMLGAAVLTPHKVPHLHFFLLYPLPPLMVAVALVTVFDWARRFVWTRILFAVILCVFASKEASSLGRYFCQMSATGGQRLFSGKIYDLADWMRINHHRGEPLLLFGDGDELQRHFYFMLPEISFDYRFVFGDNPTEVAVNFRKQLDAIGRPVHFIRWNASGTDFSSINLAKMAQEGGFELSPRANFRESDGFTVFQVFRASLPEKNELRSNP